MKCVIVPAGVKGSHIKNMYQKKKGLSLIASNSAPQNTITSIINRIRHEKFTKGIIEMAVTMTNLNKKNTRIIIGNPGCGKTTKLISELQKLYQEGTPLERIAYCSFSVAAIDEAVSRALKALKISTTTSSTTSKAGDYKGKLIYFKTLHAMAFRLLGLDSSSLLSETGMKDFAHSQGLRITGDYIRKKGLPHRMTPGDKIMQVIGVSELCNKSIRDYMVENNIHDIPINIVEKVAHNYKAFKILNSQYDYTDMLIMAKNTDIEVPELDYLFIDEAQDLSSLQWILVNKLASKAEHIIIAGDDKQAVNSFSGADVDTFLSLPGRVETLKQSYRTPKLVYDIANKLVEKMSTYRKEGAIWRPRRIEGTYNIVSSLPLDKIQKGGDWLILARGGYQLQTLANELYKIEAGQKPILFTLNNMPPIDLDAYAIIWLYKRYNKDMIRNLVSPPDSRTTPDQIANKKKYQRIFSKFIRNAFPLEEAANKEWHEIFVNEDPVKLRYLQKTYPLYESYGDEMFKKATVRLMTIHSAKGREADNVVVYLNVPKTVSDTLRYDDSDIEIKVFYVAITRAKQNLYLYQDKKQRYSYYDLI